MLHATITAAAELDTSSEAYWAEFRAKNRATDAREIRKAIQVDGLTPAVIAAVERALAAHTTAELLHETFGELEAKPNQTEAQRASCNRAEGRWSRANDFFRDVAKKVLDVPTRPGRETAAKFEAFLRLIWVDCTNPRSRKRFSAERVIDALFKNDSAFVAKAALAALRDVPTPPTGAVQIVGATMAEHISTYKAALDAEAETGKPTEYYQARYADSMAAEQALLAAEPRTLGELNAKAKAFTNPDGSVDDVGNSAQAARVIEALARDVDRLAAVVAPPTSPLDRNTLAEVADLLDEFWVDPKDPDDAWYPETAKLLRQLSNAMPPEVTASDAELLAFDAERARLWDESEKQNTDEAADALYDQSNAFEDRIRRAGCSTPVAAYLKLDIAKRDIENEFMVPGPGAAELIGQVMAYLRGVPILPCPATPPSGLSAVHRELNDLIPRFEEEENLPAGGPSWARKLELERIASLSKATTAAEAALQAAMIIAIADIAVGDYDPEHNKRDRDLLEGLAASILHFLNGPDTQGDRALNYYSWPLLGNWLELAADPEFDPEAWHNEWTSIGETAHLVLHRDGSKMFGTSLGAGSNPARANVLLDQLNAKPSRRRLVAPFADVVDFRSTPLLPVQDAPVDAPVHAASPQMIAAE